MTQVSVIYFLGSGHTRLMAEAVAQGEEGDQLTAIRYGQRVAEVAQSLTLQLEKARTTVQR
ncbi:MAG: hypothetical protein SNJ68_06080 [Cyanobacteriota bacterium]